ncbi:response regulator [Erythrobacter sp. R86502]|uniref:response regulator n=1 Tax=Erythrobacter sp. R86502 TaxID=3093846 RepID=UPI0036D2F1E0
MTDRKLSGCRIIVVEDDFYQAHDCKQMMEQAGAKVVSVSAVVPDLANLMEYGRIDAALIDINLAQGTTFDFARELIAKGIPFAFLTGYDAAILPEDLAASVCISKPADLHRVINVVANLASGQS